MTYISRRTRIIVPRWLDESDADHRYRVSKRRSDGRLKRNISCDDLRAWVNNNCIKHDYLVELMSNGEFSAKSPVRVYGRFVPVPVLAELMQGIQRKNYKSFRTEVYGGKESDGNTARPELRVRGKAMKRGVDDSSLEYNAESVKSQCKEYLLEKRLFECTKLLCKAVWKLEKIDNIACVALEESENARNEEIEEAFLQSKAVCSCSTQGKPSEAAVSSKLSLRRGAGADSFKGAELLRKISGLREKLKRIGEFRKDIKRQIKSSQQKMGKGSSTLQVTELYSRQEQEKVKKLEAALEKLIRERGKLLSEMCQALICRHSLKKASRSTVSFRGSKSSRIKAPEVKKEDCEKHGEHGNCTCGCTCTEPSESDKVEGSQSVSSERSSRLEDSDNVRQAENDSPSPTTKARSRNGAEIYKNPEKGRNEPVVLHRGPVEVKNRSAESVPAKETNNERKIKSETTMKEIEKTLRNYEKRLQSFDCLEYKIESLKQKLSEANQLKKKWIRRKNEVKKVRIAEQEKTSKEMTKLCWENWELKRQVQHLTVKLDVQSKKVEALKCYKYKVKALEGDSEELKKELAEYQENFEDQRKCINKLENVVVAQKAEMEKLMNHIRKLTTMRESFPPCEPYQEKKSAQRSRSYTPEVVKLRRNTNSRPRTQAGGSHRMSSEEEDAYASLCCHCMDPYPQDVENSNEMSNNERLGCYTTHCYTPHDGRPGRCMN